MVGIVADRLEWEKNGSRLFDDGVAPLLDPQSPERQREQMIRAYEERERKNRMEGGRPSEIVLQCLDRPEWGTPTVRQAERILHHNAETILRNINNGWLINGNRWVLLGHPWKPTMPAARAGADRVRCVERPDLPIFNSSELASHWLGLHRTTVRNAIMDGWAAGGYHWLRPNIPADQQPALRPLKSTYPVLDRKTGITHPDVSRVITDVIHEDPAMLELSYWNPAAVRTRRKQVERQVLSSLASRGSRARWKYTRTMDWKKRQAVKLAGVGAEAA